MIGKVLSLVAASLVFVVGFAATAVAGSDRTTICHATGSESNPYVEITVSNSALAAHRHHQGREDIIPAPAGGCPGEPSDIPPTETVTVTETVTTPAETIERVVERVVDHTVLVPVDRPVERVVTVEKPVTVVKRQTVVKWKTRTVVKWRTKIVVVKTKCVKPKPKPRPVGCEGDCSQLGQGMNG